MAPKSKYHERCPTCGATQARLDGEYVQVLDCECPKPPGPQSPPRRVSLRSAVFVPAELDELDKACDRCGADGTMPIGQGLYSCGECYEACVGPQRALLHMARNAMNALRDAQNGPPLIRHKFEWEFAMEATKQCIAEIDALEGK